MADLPRCGRRSFLAGLLGLAVTGGAKAQSPVATPVSPGAHVPMVRIGVADASLALDPNRSAHRDTSWLCSLAYDAPFRWNPEGEILPGILSGSRRVDQPQWWDLTIRAQIRTADGAPLNAAAVAEALAAARESRAGWRLAAVTGIKQMDEQTVRVSLAQPDASLPATLASDVMRLKTRASLGTGPFAVKSSSSTHAIMHRNPYFWQIGRPRIDALQVVVIGDDTSRSAAMATGEIQMLPNVPLLDVPMLQAEPTVYLVGRPDNRVCHIRLNARAAQVGDARVRRIISAAIDRETLVAVATANQAQPSSLLFAPDTWADPVEEIDRLSSADAREQLRQLNVPPDLRLHLIADNRDATLANTSVVLQEQLAACGISVSIALLEGEALDQAIIDGNFDLAVGSSQSWRDPHELVFPLLTSAGEDNVMGYRNAVMDDLIARAVLDTDIAWRRARYAGVEAMVQRDVPLIPLFRPSSFDAVSQQLAGYAAYPAVTSAGILSVYPSGPDESQP